MASRAEIPLNAAGEPGVGEGEVGELKTLVGEHQIPVVEQIPQRPKPATEAGQHKPLQSTVAQLDCSDPALCQLAAVAALQWVRQWIGQPTVRDPLLHIWR